MKKLLIMLSIFFVMLSICIFENITVGNFYAELTEQLQDIDVMIKNDLENIDTDEIKASVDNLLKCYDGGKYWLMTFTHHTITHQIDERMISLKEQVDTNNSVDAVVTVNIMIGHIEDIMYEGILHYSNLF